MTDTQREDSLAKLKELNEAAQPLLKFLHNHGCPHDIIIVKESGVQFLEGNCFSNFPIRD